MSTSSKVLKDLALLCQQGEYTPRAYCSPSRRVSLLDDDAAKKVIPWEPVGQCSPSDLPDVAPASHPAPWTEHHRGNGHVDLIAANGEQVAHVYLWDRAEIDLLQAKIKSVNGAG